ncbi:Helix-turn-helix domain protein [Pseudobythopirellula maris]|uniref:Helix-turn-helix domain protein n=1 Tax=Pseudobythopirellula maris TaxID=2527991 RepID=A0A5C5ZI18_9BACT|nr:helix-turn-helix domain-containing protein [Pseudobythopirellula maris]TWT86637.1 Helix-turn-helix domain protein [Pseudobythopirellula maris]
MSTDLARYLKRAEGAAYIGVSLRTLDALLAEGEIPKIGVGSRVVLDRADLDQFMAGRKSAAAQTKA